ncbi:SpoIIE family protein phosphatase [Prolixibacteraceae bacterium Z1-6]|uniref:SpoIIE family protein phosphatase n=1 Tax=Draconibacterium aestuarii TaxID=2998507 RepID=A0A9X3F953_9BACT|nr:SpoIIE family protein phosphatase [Prolixibacteraceae bacterium Z1-6]
MLNKSIAYRLSIYISFAVISVFIVFIGIYFLFNQRLIEDNVENKAISLSAEIAGEVNQYVASVREISSNISEQIIYYSKQSEAEHFISSLVKKYPFLNAVYINIDSTVTDIIYHHYYCSMMNDSVVFNESNEWFDTCLSGEESIHSLAAGKVPGWSEPYRCERNNNVVVAMYYPIEMEDETNGNRQVGEVYCELSLLELNKSVNNIKVGEHGFAFLISKGGVYITHPIEDWILNKNIFNLSKSVFDVGNFDVSSVQNEGKSGTLVAYPELFDYKKSWVYYTPVTDNGWILIFALPFKELYEPLYLPILQMLFFSVLGILIIYLLVTYITDKLIQPLSSVTQQLKMFSRITGNLEDDSDNEIIQVWGSLNSMRKWYEKYKVTSSQEAQKRVIRERDLLQASEIQQSFIKTEFPAFPNRNDIDLYAAYKPAKGVSGDLYDYFFVDDKNLVFTIGDVSGKGIPAAFFMSVAQTIIKNNANKKTARLIVEGANTELYTNNQHQFFLTLFLGVLNVETGKLNYCNAAHTTSYILKENGKLIDLANSHGLPLGLYPDKKYNEAAVQLEKGDSVIVYTDGITELQDKNKLQYGNQRLEQNLTSLAGLTPEEMVKRIEKSLNQFIGETNQSDDISILILKYTP